MPSDQDAPLKTYQDHLARGELAYQFSEKRDVQYSIPASFAHSPVASNWNGASAKARHRLCDNGRVPG